MKKQIFLLILVLAVVGGFFIIRNSFQESPTQTNQELKTDQIEDDSLRIVSTNPDPLDGATILPTQNIEFKFNKRVSVSEFKHSFDPEVEHEIQALDDSKTTTIIIIFSKPLELGSGYTLFVKSNTNGADKKELGEEHQYHFSTIKYKGV